ncbi:MAG: hypothetical protein NC930_01290 [Candidatus Omnitrophica bacterium]|nr:hypothetical protein [Candidatus Omnitrophota bacterium]
MTIEFDISWENSWRIDATTMDAVWVFMKFTKDSGATWNHCTLKTSGTTPSGFSTGTVCGTCGGLEIVVPTDKKGAFVQRANSQTAGWGSGTMSSENVRFVWDYGTDGVADSDTVSVKVFGVEMVYVATDTFYIGDGNGSSEATYALHKTDNRRFQINTSLQTGIKVDANSNDDDQLEITGIGIDGNNGLDTDGDGDIDNANFPTGWNDFYLMKYEITQQQWIDFFNNLGTGATGDAMKTNRDITAASPTYGQGSKGSDGVVYRNTIYWDSSNPDNNATTAAGGSARPYRACSYLNWSDGCAWADWAALRPMTELEFVKAAIGNQFSYRGLFVVGYTKDNRTNAAESFSKIEDGTEIIDKPTGKNRPNMCMLGKNFSDGDGGYGPVRVGIFAAGDTDSFRWKAGAGWYGNMELGGNVLEQVVTLGNSTGRSFEGTHGDGVLTNTSGYEGFATNTDWPGIDATTARGVTGATGSTYRGGCWASSSDDRMEIMDRNPTEGGVITLDNVRHQYKGFRAARTAP